MEIRGLFRDNAELISTARRLRFEAVDTFSVTVGRYKEFLQGRCACHFHEVKQRRLRGFGFRTGSDGSRNLQRRLPVPRLLPPKTLPVPAAPLFRFLVS